MKIYRFLSAVSAVSFTAAIVLFAYWVISTIDSPITGSPSGWWWFGCLLIGVFCSEIKEY